MTTSLPHRNTGGSVSDDEAIPDTDPSDVNTVSVPSEINANIRLDIQLASRKAPSLQACCWIFGELHLGNRESGKTTCERIR